MRWKYLVRQYHALRRAVMSSSRSSVFAPKSVGHGMNRRKTTSSRPRNISTATAVPSRLSQALHPASPCSHAKTAGEVKIATMVATRVRDRHCEASSCEWSR